MSMSGRTEDADLLQAARCEDLQYGQIRELSVLGDFEIKVIQTLKGAGAHLLQGARGMGKSMLLRSAEIDMDCKFGTAKELAVYVNFKTSTLLQPAATGKCYRELREGGAAAARADSAVPWSGFGPPVARGNVRRAEGLVTVAMWGTKRIADMVRPDVLK